MNKDYPQKALCVFTKYSMSKQSSYLTNELVEELSSRGIRPTFIAYEQGSQLFLQRFWSDKNEI